MFSRSNFRLSLDYATSVLEAPASSLVDDAPQKPKTPIKSRSPYYRPGNTPKKQKLKPNVKNTTIDENAVVKPFFEWVEVLVWYNFNSIVLVIQFWIKFLCSNLFL